MPKYNLNALGSEEFEHLCQSLVQQVIGPGAKVYGMGSDGSREVTFSGRAPYPSATECWDGDWIFQAKFHDVQTLGPTKARQSLLRDLDTELSAIVHKYKHPCDNFILMTNVPLTPVFPKGIKDKIDQEILPRFRDAIRHIHVWGADELCRFLDGHPAVRTTYVSLLVGGDIVARLLGLLEARETDLDELMRLYCHGCFVHEQSAALDDAGDVEDKPVELERVFVDLDVKPSKPWSDPALAEHLPEWLKQATEDEERISALSYLLDDSLEGIVLVGGPGEGKSTLAQFIAQLHRGRLIGRLKQLTAGQKVLEPPFCRVPFRVLLKEYAQWVLSARAEPTTLFHYLAGELSRECGRNVEPEQVQQIVKNAPSLLILDGLDEVPEKALRQVIVNHIAAFVNQTREVLRGSLRVLATTRPYGYAEEFSALNYLHLGIQKLSAETAVRYARLWTEARERNVREGDRILKTLALCLEDRVVSVLTQTPLQVTILLVIIRARGMPPKQREELFERYMAVIYQREQKKRPEQIGRAHV